ncbi:MULTISPECIES: amidophosphoribosyltransferase [unclassified Micromonospora]|uniref:amidophosphoribosyltransferase n=1 Tax=unclassified Micromonospora TaxID=2617518 RepID=UPI00104B5315|nr:MULTISPECIES: amidophosphoribosyltransferase [unclassified Micromonospora]TDB81170.1 amidophosphoribosyltransferase [Micromonospora sp. KC721]TDC32790.1 amidophosphoribosyltransferase [Micromonospora sp. KC213]
MRTFLAVLAGLAVIYFGVTGRDSTAEGGGVSGGIVLLAVLAALLVWHLTKPSQPVK